MGYVVNSVKGDQVQKETLKAIVGSLAEQQYTFQLLVKRLEQKGILDSGEISALYDEDEMAEFLRVFLRGLISIGLTGLVENGDSS